MNGSHKYGTCKLCGSENTVLTFHHLVPKKLHKKRVILTRFNAIDLNTYGIVVCVPCHKMIHKKIEHFDLATQYYTLGKLKHHFQLSKFITFQQKNHKNKRIK